MPRYGRLENWVTGAEARLVLERLRVLYAAEVTMTDHWLGALLTRLAELELERETVIVLVSDHGVLLGEHGWTGKISVALHPELIQVPLLLVDPERSAAGQQSSYPASTHDIAPTLLSLAGLRPPAEMEGADLSRILRGDQPPSRPFSYGGYSDNHFYRDRRWAYMADNRLERPRLFDLREDAGEARDVSNLHPDTVRKIHNTVLEQAAGPLPAYAS